MKDEEKAKAKSFGVWSTLILLAMVWGSSFILIKKALIAFMPLEVAALRVFSTFVGFIPILFIKWGEIDWKEWKYFLFVGLSGSAIPAFLFAIAQTKVNSSVAGVLNGLTPIFTLIIAFFIFKEKIKSNAVFGIIMGFVGASMLILGGDNTGGTTNILYALLIVFATVFYALNVNVIKAHFNQMNPVIISAVSFSLLGPLAGIYLFASDFIPHLTGHEYGWYSLVAVVILGVVGTGLATVLFFKLVQETDAVFASSVAFMIPVVAILWGIFDGESFVLLQLLGLMLVLTGIYLIRGKGNS